MRQGAQLDDLRFVNVFVLGPKLELVIREGWLYQIGWIFGKVARVGGHLLSQLLVCY